VEGPTGWIPRFDDLHRLFRQALGKEYTRADYLKQFEIRIPENLAKVHRIEDFYRAEVSDAPDVVFKVLNDQRRRLLALPRPRTQELDRKFTKTLPFLYRPTLAQTTLIPAPDSPGRSSS